MFLVLVSLGSLIIACISGCLLVSRVILIYDCTPLPTLVVASLWLVFVAVGAALTSFAVATGSVVHLENNDGAAHRVVGLALFYLVASVVFTAAMRWKIPYARVKRRNWYLAFTKPMENDDTDVEGSREVMGNRAQMSTKEKAKEELKAKGPLKMPHFLVSGRPIIRCAYPEVISGRWTSFLIGCPGEINAQTPKTANPRTAIQRL